MIMEISDEEKRTKERLYLRLVELVNNKLCETVKENMRPVIDDMLQNEDSVFEVRDVGFDDSVDQSNLTPTSRSPGHKERIKRFSKKFSEFSERFTDVEKTFVDIEQRQKSISESLEEFLA